jgi:hypothetical protein
MRLDTYVLCSKYYVIRALFAHSHVCQMITLQVWNQPKELTLVQLIAVHDLKKLSFI